MAASAWVAYLAIRGSLRGGRGVLLIRVVASGSSARIWVD